MTAGDGPAGDRTALAGHTTLRLGGPAGRFVEAATDAEIVAEVRAADRSGEPLLVLGGGSNLVVADEGFPGTVVHVATRGVHRHRAGNGASAVDRHGRDLVELTVAAGEDWDTVVAGCVAEGLVGLECLSGIPGLAGATPIQNVGAYGQEVAERIISVRVFDRERAAVTDVAGADCGFGYRTSVFKRSLQAMPPPAVTGRFVVLSVRFLLARDPLSAPVRYAELVRILGVSEGDRVPLGAVRSAVLGLRRGKGMVLDPDDPDTCSAGSFFLNPVLDHRQVAAMERAARAVAGPGARIPRWPAGEGQVKISAAWLIEQAGFGKGYPATGAGFSASAARISFKHTLALVNPGEASTASLLALAREIREGVHKAFGVELVSEPVLVGTSL